MLFHSQECFFSCSSYKHLNIIIRDFTSGYFYEIERKALFFLILSFSADYLIALQQGM